MNGGRTFDEELLEDHLDDVNLNEENDLNSALASADEMDSLVIIFFRNGVDESPNAFPEDEYLSEKSTVRATTDPVPKTVKYPPVIALAPLKTNGKGVLKVKPKPAALHSVQTGMVCRTTPKGLLKVVPRGPLSQMHEPRTIPGHQELPALADRLGFQTSTLSPLLQSTCGWDAEPYCEESPFPYQSGRSGRAYKSLKPPDFFYGIGQGVYYKPVSKFIIDLI
ncbi:hypothetical protein MRB53_023437 [Persea americana]|uniref:Uncharacterized protein n=1 Tax=Persea americana TaxID=3435 RepID=A0ACC2L9F0_PERAE|nr:hypothetical protein MRB53_023437 [Persea americana]